jgi:hypothetical protein
VKQYYENAEAVTNQADAIINVLRDAHAATPDAGPGEADA